MADSYGRKGSGKWFSLCSWPTHFPYRVGPSMLYLEFGKAFQRAIVSSRKRKCTLNSMIIVVWSLWRGWCCCRSVFHCVAGSTVVWVMKMLGRSSDGWKRCHRRWRRRCWRWDSRLPEMRDLFPYSILLLVSCLIKLDCIDDSLKQEKDEL